MSEHTSAPVTTASSSVPVDRTRLVYGRAYTPNTKSRVKKSDGTRKRKRGHVGPAWSEREQEGLTWEESQEGLTEDKEQTMINGAAAPKTLDAPPLIRNPDGTIELPSVQNLGQYEVFTTLQQTALARRVYNGLKPAQYQALLWYRGLANSRSSKRLLAERLRADDHVTKGPHPIDWVPTDEDIAARASKERGSNDEGQATVVTMVRASTAGGRATHSSHLPLTPGL